jgi:hypothetical protein
MKDLIRIVCDQVITNNDGTSIVSETMFSGITDLTKNTNEILIRIHPVKKRFFDAVCSGEPIECTTKDVSGRMVKIVFKREVAIMVNNPAGGATKIDYKDLYNKAPAAVMQETIVPGFDLNAAPVVRILQDGSMRVVFCTIPPAKYLGGTRFDIDDFGDKFQKSVTSPLIWDDRDVFFILKPDVNTVKEICTFLKSYTSVSLYKNKNA